MATILERFHALGIPTNKSQLSWAGERVSEAYKKSLSQGRQQKSQLENDEWIGVWDYPEAFTNDIDFIIKTIVDRG